MVASHPRLVAAEGELLGPGNDHGKRFEQPLRVLVPPLDAWQSASIPCSV